jgi:high-affinity iron transporter
MLLNSVVIILREVLEAALVLSVLLAVSRILSVNLRWVPIAIIGGVIGSVAFGLNMQRISDLFEGVGQEVVDALIQYAVFVTLAGCIFEIVRRNRCALFEGRLLPLLMTVAVALAMTREGSEILVYITGFWHMDNFLYGVGVGSLLGACIGMSVGVLFYYALLSQPTHRALWLSIGLLSLIGAGMCGQATQLMIQADWISAAGPLWDTSGILPEDSLPGQLLYALLGYEASPSAREVAIYLGALAVMALATTLGITLYRRREAQA